MIPIGDGNTVFCSSFHLPSAKIETDMIPIGDGNGTLLTMIEFAIIIETDMIPIGDGNTFMPASLVSYLH